MIHLAIVIIRMEKNNSSKRIELTQRQMFKCTSCSLEIDQFCLELNLAKERIKKKTQTHTFKISYLYFMIPNYISNVF